MHAMVMDFFINRFNHHNGIIDHDSDGKNDRKHTQYVHRRANSLKEKESTDQGNRNGNRSNDSGAEILQEDKDYQKH